jgi:biopolymer transport protein ExbD
MTGADPEDVETVLALADDPAPEIRESLTYIIVQLTKRDLTGKPASDAILKLMNNLPQDSRSVAHAMWGVKFSPEIEARVLEFCRDIPQAGGIGYNFFYGALSTQANKSEASCKRLIELLAHEDITNIAGRSAWGLQQGVARPQYGLVADAMLKVIESRSEGYLRGNALRCLQTYGDAAQAPAIKALLAKPALTAELRKSLEQTLAAFEARPSANAPAPSEKPVVVTPAAAPGAAPVAAAATVQISADGTLKWNGQELSIEALSAELKVRAKQSATYAVVVRAGKDVDYKSVLKVLNLCREANIQNVAFANDAAPATAGAEEQRVIQMLEKNRQAARLRAAQDRQHYSPEQLQEIETLYQVANTKGKRSTEARASLKQLLEKYDKANRTGCATLYLGQASEGAERLEYLTRAVEKFSDCYYFNGCQVGGYGRYVLALTLWEKGDQEKARALIGELKTTLKDATDHRGRPITELAEEAEKHFAAAAGTATP